MSEQIKELESMEGMYLTFYLNEVGYGFEISHIIEIIGIQSVTHVPDMPGHVIGVINLRGKVIPIVDVRLRFGMAQRAYDDRTCIIVVEVEGHLTGLVVDKVSEVVSISPEQIEPSPKTGRVRADFVKGMGKLGEQVKVLLDVGALLDIVDNEGSGELAEAV